MLKSQEYGNNDFNDQKSWNFMQYLENDKNKKACEEIQKKKLAEFRFLQKFKVNKRKFLKINKH